MDPNDPGYSLWLAEAQAAGEAVQARGGKVATFDVEREEDVNLLGDRFPMMSITASFDGRTWKGVHRRDLGGHWPWEDDWLWQVSKVEDDPEALVVTVRCREQLPDDRQGPWETVTLRGWPRLPVDAELVSRIPLQDSRQIPG